MCWNIASTFSFSCLYIITINLYQYYKPRGYEIKIIFCKFFLIMELLQLLQWTFGNVKYNLTEYHTCSFINTIFTYIAFILIWTQPLLFSYIGYKNYQERNFIFTRLNIINIFTAIIAIGGLLYSDLINNQNDYPFGYSNYSNTTCTYIGKNNHLVWNFTGFHIDYQVNHMLYFILCVIVFMFYQKDLLSISFSWCITLIITYFGFQVTLVELPSYWCFISVISIIIFFITSLVDIIYK